MALFAGVCTAGCLQISPPGTVLQASCSPQAIQIYLNCGLIPEGYPDYICAALPFVDAGDLSVQYAVQACDAGNEAQTVGCVAQLFPGDSCAQLRADAGAAALAQQLVAACPTLNIVCGPNCKSCRESKCLQAGITCNSACQKDASYGACQACNAACNQTQAACDAACPTN